MITPFSHTLTSKESTLWSNTGFLCVRDTRVLLHPKTTTTTNVALENVIVIVTVIASNVIVIGQFEHVL